MSVVRSLTLISATMTTGLAAGVFVLYAHTVLPGLRPLDDRDFVTAYGALDRAIVNPWFMVTAFVGALVAIAAAALTGWGRPGTGWIVVALVLYLATVAVTVVVHLPLNDALKAAGDPVTVTDAATVREAFHESRWVAWNLVRCATSLGAFGCLCWALVRHGQGAG